jgi:hypothetical protein
MLSSILFKICTAVWAKEEVAVKTKTVANKKVVNRIIGAYFLESFYCQKIESKWNKSALNFK